MFTIDEIEAIAAVAHGPAPGQAAESVAQCGRARQVTVVVPSAYASHIADTPVYVSPGMAVSRRAHRSGQRMRAAIRDGSRKLYIAYADEQVGAPTPGHLADRVTTMSTSPWSAPGASCG